ncbi:MAG: glycogen debranching protein [Desulfobacteraceae bacterium]|nr:MAG: glycogen debranching protein [Desulfobacteraceae bacterium]
MTSMHLTQTPAPGTSCVRFRGDTITFSLDLSNAVSGNAWLRTTLGKTKTTRNEIIQTVRQDDPILARAWYDIPMTRLNSRQFEITLGLTEVGHFEAKCLFFKTNESTPVWPDGDNAVINVETADMCCGNIIYNAFVRQFGPNKSGAVKNSPKKNAGIQALDQEGYTVIPPSGTFRDLIGELDFIIHTLGCRILHLLPINPTPTTYGRMGRFGSPYAALDFTGIDPALAVFDPKATPLEQFIELVDAVHRRNAKIIIDLAPNHTGWAAELHETHPQWLVRDKEGKIEAPGAWGVVWEDLTRLDYTNRELWKYMADVFLTWCHRGVDGFRCDAGYMIPVPAWNFIVASVRDQYPDTIFFLEGLGGKISVTRQILNESNFNWAYSELFQNYDRGQIESYLPQSDRISVEDGLMIHFAETHDNNRLAATSNEYAAMRTALCALVSQCGGFGFANGVEWFADQKIMVHDACSLNWKTQINQVDWIGRINRLLTRHPAFFDQARIQMIQQGEGNFLAILRHHPPSRKQVLVLINLDMNASVQAAWEVRATGISSSTCMDLLTGQPVCLKKDNERYLCLLPPGAVRCLSFDPEDADIIEPDRDFPTDGQITPALPERIIDQRLRALILDVYRCISGTIKLEGLDMDQAIRSIVLDPEDFCRSMNPHSKESRVVTWQYPCDCRRQVMVPPDHFLLVRSHHPFHAKMMDSKRRTGKTLAAHHSLKSHNGNHFALFMPQPVPGHHVSGLLKLTVFADAKNDHVDAPVIYLTGSENAKVKNIFTRHELLNHPLRFLGTNGRGGMMRANAWWGKIESKYDALLAANLNPDYPDTRWMMLIRCRAWLVFQGYSQTISTDCLKRFWFDSRSQCGWEFAIPCGQGQHVLLIVNAAMFPGINRIRLSFARGKAHGDPRLMPDYKSVQLILRPDIDDRSFHHTTKAYAGPESQWPAAIAPRPQGFMFTPHPDRVLEIAASAGKFTLEPEWQYMVDLPMDAERGMDAHTDLFSPGYFSVSLKGDETFDLSAAAHFPWQTDAESPENIAPFNRVPENMHLHEMMRLAMKHYVVKRNSHKTIIAGYPWFLDWGRDTLIVTRGLIAEGFIEETKEILKQFAKFELKGTLPNVLFGSDTRNRDTSDAPLWLVAACKELIQATGDSRFLNETCGNRALREILTSIVNGYFSGTDNGIYADPDTGLIFSPSHFTWMDTNFPAATPREGFPVEIQALWYNALTFIAQIEPPDRMNLWKDRAALVQASLQELFYLKESGYLSDCLHASRGTSARAAQADDALRPNQLLAVTLNAISDPSILRSVVQNCASLIVPGGIRSLADQKVRHPLSIYRDGQLLNDPFNPYYGTYSGDEDTRRKPAYHNGTAWTWIFPSFCEAWVIAFGDKARNTARALMGSTAILTNTGCAGQLPEILDGDYPHQQKGCDAQAWSVSEWLRVWRQLSS